MRNRFAVTSLRSPRFLVLILIVPLMLGACEGEGLPDGSLTIPEGGTLPDGAGTVTLPDESEAPPETEAPEETPETEAPEETPDTEAPEETPDTEAPEETPETTVPAGEEEESEDAPPVPIWLLVVLGLVVIVIIAWLTSRASRNNSVATGPPNQEWTATTTTAYAEARRLYDEWNVPLALWRGDDLFEKGRGGSVGDPTRQSTWDGFAPRLDTAQTALYKVEAMAPGSPMELAARNLTGALIASRASVDRLADARMRRRTIEADSNQPTDAVDMARSSEERATEELNSARQRLGEALTAFSDGLGPTSPR